MPNIKSAKKRLKTSARRRQANRGKRSRIRTAAVKLEETLAAGDAALKAARYREYCSATDKAAKTGALKRNTANRRKSRAARAINRAAG